MNAQTPLDNPRTETAPPGTPQCPDRREGYLPTPAGPDPPLGGLGGGCGLRVVDPRRGIRDTRLIERALRERWEIPPEPYAEVPEALLAVIRASKSEREWIAAAKALISAGQHNLAVSRLAVDAEREKAPGQLHLHTHTHAGPSLLAELEAMEARQEARKRGKGAQAQGVQAGQGNEMGGATAVDPMPLQG
jgi:hypothetical protein